MTDIFLVPVWFDALKACEILSSFGMMMECYRRIHRHLVHHFPLLGPKFNVMMKFVVY